VPPRDSRRETEGQLLPEEMIEVFDARDEGADLGSGAEQGQTGRIA
jgi:hypothetical protein